MTASGPELVIGLVAPIGTDLPAVAAAVREAMQEVSYEAFAVKLSRLICDYQRVAYPDLPTDERYDELMTRGTDVRQSLQRSDALALLSIAKIREIRSSITGNTGVPASRHAYLLDSLKTPGEAETLRAAYGDSFLLLAVYSRRAQRLSRLASQIAESRHAGRADTYRASAEKLLARDEMERDEEQRGMRFGQNVQEVFPLADAFVDGATNRTIRDSVFRTIRLLFSHPFHTPSRDEQGMYFAKAAGLRSASLARQVGAAITTREGELKCLGTNEVPKSGGGMYWEGDAVDERDFVLGRDVSDDHRRRLAADVLQQLVQAGWIDRSKAAETVDALTAAALETKPERGPLRRARLMDILEFVRGCTPRWRLLRTRRGAAFLSTATSSMSRLSLVTSVHG